MSVLDKVRKLRQTLPQGGGQGRTTGIFKDWEEGPNRLRLVGEFIEVRTHWISPAPKRGERGLCQPEAFTDAAGDDRLPKVINCTDWDVENEEAKKKKTCPICMLHDLARKALKELEEEGDEDDKAKEEVEYFKNLLNLTRYRRALKWNIFDRDNPNVTVVDDSGNESKRKGLKIATIGMEAWKDIDGIFQQCGFDITDPDEGVDIKVIKGHNGTRVEYSAQVELEGTTVKTTPFDDEEKKLVAQPHDLLAFCGKQVDPDVVRAALHGQYAQTLEINLDDDFAGNDDGDDGDDDGESNSNADYDALPVDDDDDDALLGGETSKKKRR